MTYMIRQVATKREITRLCHFTPSRNLVHIATGLEGLLSTKHLTDDEKAVFNPTDILRIDGFKDHVCCSIEFPNAWYFKKARERNEVFPDWIVLFIKPHHLWNHGTKFCPRNAATRRGAEVREGASAFNAMFAQNVTGSGGSYHRKSHHPAFLPTNQQAEVLIPDCVSREDLLGIAVFDKIQAEREATRLKILGVDVPRIFVAPDFFRPEQLSQTLLGGSRPPEEVYTWGECD